MSTDAVTPLRHRMIEDMNARKLSAGTQRGHIRSCKRFPAFLWPPERVSHKAEAPMTTEPAATEGSAAKHRRRLPARNPTVTRDGILAWHAKSSGRACMRWPRTTSCYLLIGDKPSLGQGVAIGNRFPHPLACRLRSRGNPGPFAYNHNVTVGLGVAPGPDRRHGTHFG